MVGKGAEMKGDWGIKASEVGKTVSEYETPYRTCKIWTWLVQGIKKEKQIGLSVF